METAIILIYMVVRCMIRVLCIFPIKKHRILFESYKGKSYSCNPKYIFEKILELEPNRYEIIWVLNDPSKYNLPGIYKTVKKKSFAYILYHMTSKYIITNMTDDVYIPKRGKQIVINTWHAGGAYKRVGLSYANKRSKLTAWQDKIVRDETSYYISSSKLFTKYNIIEAYGYKGRIINEGMPRNDLFFYKERVNSAKEKIKKTFDISNSLIILYAPTFRGDFGHAEDSNHKFPFMMVLEALNNSGASAVIMNRSHYSLSSTQKNVAGVVDVSDYPDMQELLAAADVLVTDYSSSIWDYSLLGRPCILFVPDKETYLADRGVYTPMERWPGEIAESEEELIRLITHIDSEYYRKKAEASLLYYGSYEKGHASEKIVEIIKEEER